jgi:metal-responsive CopG/Arc/MetJ family transcriptional regulator
MQTVQIVLDETLLLAADQAAQKRRVNRSALFREALRVYLRQMSIREKEEQDRAGYELHPDGPGELDIWERVAVWPES